MEEKEFIGFDKQQILELVQIVFDNDKDAAFKFLEENIYRPLQKQKQSKCKPEV